MRSPDPILEEFGGGLHPSLLELEAFILSLEKGEEGGSVGRHVAECTRCAEMVERMRADDMEFIEAFPTSDALAGAIRPRSGSTSPVRSRWSWSWSWGLGIAAAAAAACITALFFLRLSRTGSLSGSPKSPERADRAPLALSGSHGPDGVRSKGSSIVEVAVSRQGRSFPYSGQPLHAGDVLAFRYTTRRNYLLLMGLEQSGKISVFMSDTTTGASMGIKPGRKIRLDHGIELDDYPGPELLIFILSDSPLSASKVKKKLKKQYEELPDRRKKKLALGRLPFEGDQVTFFLYKSRRD